MNVYEIGMDHDVLIKEPITACIGYFDGLHLGHQKLIAQVLSISKETGTVPSLITFDPDPWTVLKGIKDIPHITPMNKRMQLASELGIQNWIMLNFTKEMAALSIDDFHKHVLARLSLHTLVCGYDFHYADKGSGNVASLRAVSAFDVCVIEEVASEHRKISSTRIEELIKAGEMEKVTSMMGRPYEIDGVVKKGNQVGRTVGFPTANLLVEEQYLMPRQGVYVGEVRVKGHWHQAMMNVGHNPSFNYQQKTSIEAHILDFDEDIYGENVTFRFLAFIRGECQFKDKASFMEQLHKDTQTTRAYKK